MAAEISAAEQEKIVSGLKVRFDYATKEWADIRREGKIDIRCVAGDPWAPKERQAREEANRPCLSLDELGQYVNQLINEIRQHKRAIKVTPIGNGSRDAIARLRANLIRQIEYRSNAQIAYTTGFENTVQRSYGFWRVKPRYEHPRSFNQELIIEPFENPDMVTPDPDDLSPVGADMKYAFVHEWWDLIDFKRRWPNAKVKGYSAEWQKAAPKWWSKQERVQVAEYWTIEPEERELLHLQTANGLRAVFADELETPSDDDHPLKQKRWLAKFGQIAIEVKRGQAQVINRRTVEYPCVYQYMTNGIELLPPDPEKPKELKHKWPGTSIPIIACYGKVLWVDDDASPKGGNILGAEDGSGAKRRMMSLVRLARDPQMLYCYYRTCEAELVGMTPKTPFVGYVGQFRTRTEDWQKVNHEPLAYLEADPFTEATGNQTLLPLPQRQPYDPPIQPLEVGAESARRAIQAAMGIMPLPTSAQRQNEKSGIALERIKSTSQQGSFHFVDHYEMAITRTGAILDELLPHYYDATRDVTVRTPADETETVRINDPESVDEESGQPLMLREEDIHDVTLSTGPSQDSEREAATDFADGIVQNIQNIAGIIGPQASAKLISLAVKLKNVGPIGDEIADTVSPQSKDGKPTAEQLQAELEKAMQVVQGLTQALEEKTRVIETDQVKAQQRVSEIQTKEQAENERTLADIASKERITFRELEVKLEIELAKLNNAAAVARAQIEMQDLHHHDAIQQQEADRLETSVQSDMDRQAAQDAAAMQAQAKAEPDSSSASA